MPTNAAHLPIINGFNQCLCLQIEIGIEVAAVCKPFEQLVKHSLDTSCLDCAVKQRKSAAQSTPNSNNCINFSLSISI